MYLLPLIAVGYAAGLLLREPAFAAALLSVSLPSRRLLPVRPALLSALLGSLMPLSSPPSPLHLAMPDGAPLVRITGTVMRGPDLPRGRTTSLTLQVDTVGPATLAGAVTVLLPENAPLPPPGTRVKVLGRLFPPRAAMNPGQRDARAFLAQRGIHHLLELRSGAALSILERPGPMHPKAMVHRLRLGLDRRLSALPHERTGRFLSCLLLGRRDLVHPRTTSDFQRSGTIHFLAISGLHIGLLAGLLWMVLRLTPIPVPVACVLVAAAALLYATVTGLRPPALRAASLVALWAFGTSLRRPVQPLVLLSFAALLILLFDPGAMSRAGFQLSFCAVLSILLLSGPLTRGLFPRDRLLEKFSVPRSRNPVIRTLRGYLVKSVPVSLAAWFGTAPILLTRFGALSLLVVPANLLVFPFIAALLPLGLLAAATGIELPAHLLVESLCGLTRLLASLPFATVEAPPPPLSASAAFYLLLLLAGRRGALGRRWTVCLVGALALLTVSGRVADRRPRQPRFTVLSVGHGLATVLETPEGGVLVYDAGSMRPRLFETTLHPFFRHRGITTLDRLVLSHADHDHTSAAADLIRAFDVLAVDPPDSLEAGDRISIPGAKAVVLWPPGRTALSDNNRSAVLRVDVPGMRILLAGDVEEDAIRGLLENPRDLRADVLVLPHHGARVPLAARLVRAVSPEVLIASDGETDSLDPAYRGALRTSVHGAITVRPGPEVERFRTRSSPR